MLDPRHPRTPARVAVFAMPEAGHFQRLRPLIAALARRGFEVCVFTHRDFAAATATAGGKFIDLFERYRIEDADSESQPVPCRFVTFAARYAEPLLRELEALRPSLVVYDTFAVIGRVLARSLGVPYVNVCAGHNMDPREVDRLLANHPGIQVSEQCVEAVEILRDRWGVEDASPFAYLTGTSPYLNLCCEPSAFLTEPERAPFEPLAFFGSLFAPDGIALGNGNGGPSPFGGRSAKVRAYVSFGTVVWRYWPGEALNALRAIGAACRESSDTRALVSLGGAEIGASDRRAIEGGNVTVEKRVPQWQTLRDATVFVTHHGLNSTHEAIYHGVPMISYPFFSDQPALARRCQELGLAIPLVERERTPPRPDEVAAALSQVTLRREELSTRLAEAREWELEAIAGRGAVLDRIVELVA